MVIKIIVQAQRVTDRNIRIDLKNEDKLLADVQAMVASFNVRAPSLSELVFCARPRSLLLTAQS